MRTVSHRGILPLLDHDSQQSRQIYHLRHADNGSPQVLRLNSDALDLGSTQVSASEFRPTEIGLSKHDICEDRTFRVAASKVGFRQLHDLNLDVGILRPGRSTFWARDSSIGSPAGRNSAPTGAKSSILDKFSGYHFLIKEEIF